MCVYMYVYIYIIKNILKLFFKDMIQGIVVSGLITLLCEWAMMIITISMSLGTEVNCSS